MPNRQTIECGRKSQKAADGKPKAGTAQLLTFGESID